jgi:hypothetical protein
MFPIRSLTPQQATGNALAAGFTLHGARHKTEQDIVSTAYQHEDQSHHPGGFHRIRFLFSCIQRNHKTG